MTYQEIETDTWKPSEKGDEIEGVFVKAEENVGANDSNLYHLEVDEKPVAVWGSTVLDTKMIGIKPGEKIKIVFDGLGESKPGKNPPKIFKVYIDK